MPSNDKQITVKIDSEGMHWAFGLAFLLVACLLWGFLSGDKALLIRHTPDFTTIYFQEVPDDAK